MGYRRNKVYVLGFEHEDLAGLEIRARGASVHLLMRATALAEIAQNIAGTPTEHERSAIAELVSVFAGCPAGCRIDHIDAFGSGSGQHYSSRIISWNFEDEDGAPIDPTPENFFEQDLDLTLPVVMAWIEEIGGTPGPLEMPSSAGGPSEGESIPMDVLSDGQQF